ncbi:MAG: DUF5677 domain-containing protein [Candidatus Omnitrophota bacterium]
MKLNQLVYVWRRIKFLEKVIRTAETLLKYKDVNKEEYSPIKYVVLHFHVKAIKLVRGLLALCNAGLMSDAKILLRSLFEVAYYCEYILIDPKDIKAAENIMALAAFENKNTEEGIIRYGGVDIDKMAINEKDKDFLKIRVPQKTQNVENNYSFIVERLRKRCTQYGDLSADKILEKEGIINKSFLEGVNKIFNEETSTKNFWKRYKNILRDCSKFVHALDFETNVMKTDEKLEYKLKDREETGKVILSATTTFLIRIMDVANEVLNFKSDDKIKKLFNEAMKLS